MPLRSVLCLVAAAILALPVQAATEGYADIQAPALVPRQLAPGVYAVVGRNALPSPQNQGAVGNQGIIVGDEGVILIDTGTNARYAHRLIQAVKRLTPKPIVLAINTHQNPAFVFGNGTLAQQGVPILAHRDVAALITRHCETCLKNLVAILGAQEMQGTRVVAPTRRIDHALSLVVAGRRLDIVYFGQSSSPGSIAVLDHASGVLFAGGLVSLDRVPVTKDAHIAVWLTALQSLKKLKPAIMVPGEGPVAPVGRVDDLARYLGALQSAVQHTYQQGTSLGQAASATQLTQFEHWPLYEPIHNQNVEHLYLQIERAAFDGE